jgi:RNA polymerase sigma factor (sigma-70 family)
MSVPPTSGVGTLQDREARDLRPLVRGVVAHVLGESVSSADVEECTQEALRRALEGRQRLKADQALAAWVAGIARHVALDEIRARRRSRARTVAPASARDGAPEQEPLDSVADPSPDPFEKLAQADRDADVRTAMATLPEKQRAALTLFHLEGLDYKAIAERLGVPLGTVATWVMRGRRAMAERLQAQTEREDGK